MRLLARLCIILVLTGDLCGGFVSPARTSVPKALRTCDVYPTVPAASLLQFSPSDESQIRVGKTNHRFSSSSSLFSSRTNEQPGDGRKTPGLVRRLLSQLNRVNNPKVYLGLLLVIGLRYRCFTNPIYYIAGMFCIKWYRARYVYKIPVWDRQPNWNNVITSKEQEKDLKAFTCKNCGSTLFVAKDRGFFFEGKAGLAGLGCFTCGAKGEDNFVNDRERIVEDVADMDDYFDYEQPLDFVSAAERKKLLKQSGGDAAKANQILLDRAAAATGSQTSASPMAGNDVVDAEFLKTSSPPPPQSEPTDAGSNPTSSSTKKGSKAAGDDDVLDLLDMD